MNTRNRTSDSTSTQTGKRHRHEGRHARSAYPVVVITCTSNEIFETSNTSREAGRRYARTEASPECRFDLDTDIKEMYGRLATLGPSPGKRRVIPSLSSPLPHLIASGRVRLIADSISVWCDHATTRRCPASTPEQREDAPPTINFRQDAARTRAWMESMTDRRTRSNRSMRKEVVEWPASPPVHTPFLAAMIPCSLGSSGPPCPRTDLRNTLHDLFIR